MITLYLLKGCKHCSKVLKYLSHHTVDNLLLFILNKTEALKLKNLIRFKFIPYIIFRFTK